jgi:hypothetical protein
LRVFNIRQESDNGTQELRTGSRSVPQYGTRIRDWGPALPAIALEMGGECKLFEELLCLDARWLARKKLFPKNWSTTLRYNFDFIIPHVAGLTLTAGTAKILTRDGREQTVAIHWQHNSGIGYGSIRPMFVCRCSYGAYRLYDVFDAFRCLMLAQQLRWRACVSS